MHKKSNYPSIQVLHEAAVYGLNVVEYLRKVKAAQFRTAPVRESFTTWLWVSAPEGGEWSVLDEQKTHNKTMHFEVNGQKMWCDLEEMRKMEEFEKGKSYG